MRLAPGSRLRAVWAAMLSLVFPGLGQVFARAFWLGAGLLALNEALSAGLRLISILAPPIVPAIAAMGAVALASVLLLVATAADAYRRIRRGSDTVRASWFRSTWFAAVLLVLLGAAMDEVLPIGWQTFNIPSDSMLPTLEIGDYLFSDARPGAHVPARGDVMVFHLPRDPETLYVKRLIGLPGDRIAMQDGVPVLNGVPLQRHDEGSVYIPAAGSFGRQGHRWMETLPDGRSYAILATDLPPGSTGRDMAEQVVPPDRLFLLGDNRDNSRDSRFADPGLVPIDNLVGPATTLYWSNDRARLLTPVR